MKLLLGIFLFLFSLSAFADGSAKYFFGSGKQVTRANSKEVYLISLTVNKVDMQTSKYHYNVMFQDRSAEFVFFYSRSHANQSFFDVQISDGESLMNVGYGYCWGAFCHTNVSLGNLHIEHSYVVHRQKGSIHGWGSKKNAEGDVSYVWTENLKRIK